MTIPPDPLTLGVPKLTRVLPASLGDLSCEALGRALMLRALVSRTPPMVEAATMGPTRTSLTTILLSLAAGEF